jgi:hypothetical protein
VVQGIKQEAPYSERKLQGGVVHVIVRAVTCSGEIGLREIGFVDLKSIYTCNYLTA